VARVRISGLLCSDALARAWRACRAPNRQELASRWHGAGRISLLRHMRPAAMRLVQTRLCLLHCPSPAGPSPARRGPPAVLASLPCDPPKLSQPRMPFFTRGQTLNDTSPRCHTRPTLLISSIPLSPPVLTPHLTSPPNFTQSCLLTCCQPQPTPRRRSWQPPPQPPRRPLPRPCRPPPARRSHARPPASCGHRATPQRVSAASPSVLRSALLCCVRRRPVPCRELPCPSLLRWGRPAAHTTAPVLPLQRPWRVVPFRMIHTHLRVGSSIPAALPAARMRMGAYPSVA
jgi:hypothetical protein